MSHNMQLKFGRFEPHQNDTNLYGIARLEMDQIFPIRHCYEVICLSSSQTKDNTGNEIIAIF